ncbi:hypothetical protein ACSW8S_16015 (plasmid) [Clostridium perfringens]
MNLDGLILIERKGNVKFYRKGRKFYQNIGDGEIIPLKDGDIRYKKIKTVNGYTIKYNLNGVYGFSLWKGTRNLEDRFWSIEEAEKAAKEM